MGGYKCANGPTGCGCVKDALSSPGSCYEKIVDGHAQCHGRCSVSGYHCANGPTGCGCIKQVLASNASSPGSCYEKIVDGHAQCHGRARCLGITVPMDQQVVGV